MIGKMVVKLVVAGCLALAVAAIGHHTQVRAAQESSAATITMLEYTYSPKTTMVSAGATVVWRNSGKEAHTATVAGDWDTGSVAPGAEARVSFDKPGVYRYVCQFHGGPTGEGMNGTLVVTAAPTPSPSPAAPSLPPVGGAGLPVVSLVAAAIACLALGLRLRQAR